MKTVLKNGKIITGDGKSVVERGHVVIHGELVTKVGKGSAPRTLSTDRVIDARGKIIIPGIINHHEHYLTLGPGLLGDHPWYGEQVIEHLNIHLLQGTTTMLNMDGLVTPDEVEKTNRLHPINLKTATMHMPTFVRAVEYITGCPGFKNEHKKLSVEEAVKNGAVAIGEVEELTIWAALVYIPQLIWRKTGRSISPLQSRRLQQSVLGDVEHPPPFDAHKVGKILEEIGLSNTMNPKGVKELLESTVLRSHRLCHKVYLEAGRIAERLGVPVVAHYALESKDWVVELATRYAKKVNIIAAHCDSITFSDIKETLNITKKLRELGVITNVTSYMQNHVDPTEICVRLFEEKLVDTVCTDAAGQHDPILFFLERLIEEKLTNLPEAIAMVTSNVVKAIPDLAPHRGLVEEGKVADLVLIDEERISDVEMVMIGGQIVVEDGCHSREELPLMGPPPFGPGGRILTRELYTKLPSELTCRREW